MVIAPEGVLTISKPAATQEMRSAHYIATALCCDKSDVVAISCAKRTILRQNRVAIQCCRNIVRKLRDASVYWYNFRSDHSNVLYCTIL